MPNQSAIRLLQITDTHLLGSRDGLLRGIPTFANLQAVYAHAQQHFHDGDGVLLTGDLVQDEAAGYTLIREVFQTSTVPVYCLPGNHDLPDAMHDTLAKPPFVHDDHIIMNEWLLLMLNSWQAKSAGGALGKAQLQRMNQLLTQHADRHTLICLHHHPIRMHSDWLDEVGLQDAAAFRACVANHAQVRGVLWGHVHQQLDQHIDGVHYMATPATCSQFLPHSSDFALDNKPPGYRILQLGADGSIGTDVIWLD
jgi:3',5'-cyclic-AMP phosphodiesterase